MERISRKIVRNTLFNMVGGFWSLLIKVLLTPIIIAYIGVDKFGIWAFVLLFTGYFALLDLSIGTAIVKYVSQYYAKREFESINKVVNSAFVFYASIGMLSCGLAFFLIRWIVENVLRVPASLLYEANFVLVGAVVIFAFSNAMSVFNSVIIGLQRMDVTNKVRISVAVLEGIGTILVLVGGYGLIGLIINAGVIAIITSLAYVLLSKNILPKLAIGSRFIDTRILKELVIFGTKVQFSRIADVMHFQTDKLFISYFLQLRLVAFYEVAAIAAFTMRMVSFSIVSAILPAASEIEATMEKKSQKELYLRSSKYLSLISVPLVFFMFFFATAIIDVWLGEGFELSATTLQVLVIGYFANIMTFPGTQVATGLGKPEYVMKSSIIAAVLNLILSVLLIMKIGYMGAPLGTSLAMVLAACYFILVLHKHLKISNFGFFKSVSFPPVGASAFALFPLYLAAYFLHVGLVEFIIGGIFFCVLYPLGILKMNYLDDYDITLIREYLPIKI